MLEKKIKYTDLRGHEREDTFMFHLNKSELLKLEISVPGGFTAKINKMVDKEDAPEIVETFENFILSSYGEISEDGKSFIKNKELTDRFKNSEAYSELFMELISNPESAKAFVAGVIPVGINIEEQEKLMAIDKKI